MTKKQVREMAAWCYQFVGAHDGTVEALDNLSAIAQGGEPPHEWRYPIRTAAEDAAVQGAMRPQTKEITTKFIYAAEYKGTCMYFETADDAGEYLGNRFELDGLRWPDPSADARMYKTERRASMCALSGACAPSWGAHHARIAG